MEFIAGSKDKSNECMYTFISEMDQLPEDVLVIATSSQSDKVDKAVRRGGRLDIDVRLDMPTDQDRFEVFNEHFRTLPNKIDRADLQMISRASSGFVCSDIA